MRTFISDNIQKIIDLDHKKLDTSVTERCESITGGALRILGHMPGEVKFCKNKKTYVGNFLVCTNIGYDCVLGWDFLVHNNLDLRGEMFRSHHLVGSHGKTRVSAVGCTKSSNKSVSGVLEASLGTEKAPKFEASDDFLLAQSNIKAPVFVALENNVIIQGRCEMIVPGRLAKSPTHNIGMISPIHRADKKAPHQSLNCHVANTVVRWTFCSYPNFKCVRQTYRAMSRQKNRRIYTTSPII